MADSVVDLPPHPRGSFGRTDDLVMGVFGAFVPGGSGISIHLGWMFCSLTMLKRNADGIPAFLRISVRRKY